MPFGFTRHSNGPGKTIQDWHVNELQQGVETLSHGVYNVLEAVDSAQASNPAKGDGTTDDTAAIALADSANGGNGVTHFPATTGGYLVGSSVTLSHPTRLPPGAKFKLASGKTLTLNGTIDAGPYQIFDLSAGGSVALGPGAVKEYRLEWWGGGVGVDNTDAWTALLAAAPNGAVVTLGQGTYPGTFALPQEPQTIHIRGMGIGVTILQQRSATEPVINGNPATGQCSKSTISGVSYKVFAGGSTVPLINLFNARQIHLVDPEYLSNSGDALSFISLGGSHCYGIDIYHPTMQAQVGPAKVISFVNGGDNSTNCNIATIRNGWFFANSGTGTIIDALRSASVTITDNEFENNTNYVPIIPGTSTKSRGNWLEGNSGTYAPATVAGQGTTNGCELGPDYHSSTGVTITFPSGCSNNVLNQNWPDANLTMVDNDKTNEKRIGLVRGTNAVDGIYPYKNAASGAHLWQLISAATGSSFGSAGDLILRNATTASRAFTLASTAPDEAIRVSSAGIALGTPVTGLQDKGSQVYNALAYTVKGDNSTDNATPFGTWKAAIPTKGGRGLLPTGIYKTSGTLLVPSYTHIDGVPGTGLAFGGTNDYLSGSCLLWTGATGGTVLSFYGASLSDVRGINVNGGGISGVTGALFDSNNAPASKTNALEAFQIYACGTLGVDGYGVKIGTDPVAQQQADTVTLRRGFIINCGTGVGLLSVNAAFQTLMEQVVFSGNVKGISLISSENVKIDTCDFGGHTTYSAADIWEGQDGSGHGGSGAITMITNCETEKNPNGNTWFLLVDSSCTANLSQPYTLIGNVLANCGILLKQSRNVKLISNNFFDCNFVVAGGNPIIYDDNTFFSGVGMRNVTDLVTTSGSNIVSSATAAFVVPTGSAGAYSALGDQGKRFCDPTSGNGGITVAGFPQVALVGTVIDAQHVALVDGNGNPVNATATATGVSARFDYGFVIPPSTGELISNSINSNTDFPQQTFHSRANADVVRVTSVNPAVSWLGFGIDATVAGGHHWQMVAGGTQDPGAWYLVDGANRVVSVNPNVGTDRLNVNGYGVTVTGGYTQSQTAVKTANYSVTSADGTILCDPTAGGFTVTFPANVGVPKGRDFTLVNVSASTNPITIAFADGSTIQGASTLALTTAWGHTKIQPNGTNKWYVVG